MCHFVAVQGTVPSLLTQPSFRLESLSGVMHSDLNADTVQKT